MKCKNCKTENILKADYCKGCGHQFTEKEKKKAYNRTIFGIIDNIGKVKSYITFDFITGNRWFKVASLMVLILYSFLVLKINGNQMRVLDSRDYDVEYNKTTKEYYLITDENQIGLELYIPEKAETVNLITVDNNDNPISSIEYPTDQQVMLTYNNNYHYIVQSNKQQLEMYIIIE